MRRDEHGRLIPTCSCGREVLLWPGAPGWFWCEACGVCRMNGSEIVKHWGPFVPPGPS